MGFHLCRRRTWRIQDNWRSCRTDGICLFDGHSKTDLWKVWRPYQSEWIYGFECRAMHYLLSLYIPYSSSAYWPSWLCNLWFLCWHYVAGNHFQSCLCHSWWGGTAMFAMFAVAGDIGCTAGPSLAGFVADLSGKIGTGILSAIIFPVIMFALLLVLMKKRRA